MRRVLIATAVLALVAPGAAEIAAAAPTPMNHAVQVGAVNPTNPLAPYVYTRYYPSQLQVHRGDTVTWDVAFESSIDLAFHSITFLGGNSVARPPLLRSDETPGSLVFTEPIWDRTSSTCGVGDLAPCVLSDARQPLSSGVLALRSNPPSEFTARIDLPVGRYRYVCTIHASMAGSVQVVPPRAPLRNPSSAEITRQIAKDTANANALVARYSKPAATTVDGQRTWNVVMEPRTADKHVSVLGYFPTELTVRTGDRVRWVTHDEFHTVAFPDESMDPPGPSFFPWCDPDAPQGGAVGIPYPSLDCPLGSAEVHLGPGLSGQIRAPGDAVVSEATVHSSGVVAELGGPAYYTTRPDGSLWPTEFGAAFPVAGTFGYVCLVHPELPMVGAVTVE